MPDQIELSLLYRGPLASCDYACRYCPLEKRRESGATLRADRVAVDRFVNWVAVALADHPGIGVLFTPWGEALIRPWYRDALVRLSHLPQVVRVAAQTNLSRPPHWVADADPASLALWCTYHPEQTTLARFLASCSVLTGHRIRFSVGIVGTRQHLAAARELRAGLPATVYLWVNAEPDRTYPPAEEAAWTAIDPLFGYSVRPHPTLGAACRTGRSVFSVTGDGTVRRCHFVAARLGNLYHPAAGAPGPWHPGTSPPAPPGCPNDRCDCHIGYVHLCRLPLYQLFAGGVLERVPAAVTSGPAGGTPRR